MAKRFIEFARDGGCGRKVAADDLQSMLASLHSRCSNHYLADIARTFPDTGAFVLNGCAGLASVDLVTPMVSDPSDFGTIAALHSLSDVYAAIGTPIAALAIVGIPDSLSPTSSQVIDMITSASDTLAREGVVLIGGHTLVKQSDLFFGFSVIAAPPKYGTTCPTPCLGDPIVLTKRLGSGVATAYWKGAAEREGDFADVLYGMKQSSVNAAEILRSSGVHACTDVSGYGTVNHLHFLLLRLGLSATVRTDDLPLYESIQRLPEHELSETSLYYSNFEFAKSFCRIEVIQSAHARVAALESQVNGGLLFTCPRESLPVVMERLAGAGCSATAVGEICDGAPGSVLFV